MNNLERSIPVERQLRKAKKKQLTRISDQRIREVIRHTPMPGAARERSERDR